MATHGSVPLAGARRRGGLIWRPGFRRLWAADAVSQVGTQISMLALPLAMVSYLHASAFEVGLLAACQTAAFLVAGLPAGAWCDRVRRRPVVITADASRALLLASVPFAAVLHALTVAQLLVVALAAGTATVFFDVAYQSYLPELPSRDELMEGNGKLSATGSLAQVGGPALAGALIQALTAPGSRSWRTRPASCGQPDGSGRSGPPSGRRSARPSVISARRSGRGWGSCCATRCFG